MNQCFGTKKPRRKKESVSVMNWTFRWVKFSIKLYSIILFFCNQAPKIFMQLLRQGQTFKVDQIHGDVLKQLFLSADFISTLQLNVYLYIYTIVSAVWRHFNRSWFHFYFNFTSNINKCCFFFKYIYRHVFLILVQKCTLKQWGIQFYRNDGASKWNWIDEMNNSSNRNWNSQELFKSLTYCLFHKFFFSNNLLTLNCHWPKVMVNKIIYPSAMTAKFYTHHNAIYEIKIIYERKKKTKSEK